MIWKNRLNPKFLTNCSASKSRHTNSSAWFLLINGNIENETFSFLMVTWLLKWFFLFCFPFLLSLLSIKTFIFQGKHLNQFEQWKKGKSRKHFQLLTSFKLKWFTGIIGVFFFVISSSGIDPRKFPHFFYFFLFACNEMTATNRKGQTCWVFYMNHQPIMNWIYILFYKNSKKSFFFAEISWIL